MLSRVCTPVATGFTAELRALPGQHVRPAARGTHRTWRESVRVGEWITRLLGGCGGCCVGLVLSGISGLLWGAARAREVTVGSLYTVYTPQRLWWTARGRRCADGC